MTGNQMPMSFSPVLRWSHQCLGLLQVSDATVGAHSQERSDSLFLCTQNIDNLHERAGSERVVHMHGELLKARCTSCGETAPWHENSGVV